ncbi:MAG: amidohydrolase family protein, partial [Opitutae bacterium]|nr:amidohydrolase family protein [Opitutae bacterium]
MRFPTRPILAGAVLLAATWSQAKILIHAGALIDGRSDTVNKTVTVTVEGDRVTGVTAGYTAPDAGDTVIDLRNATVMPGLMDMHVHLTSEQSGTAGYADRYYLNPADFALHSTVYAKKTLLAGF